MTARMPFDAALIDGPLVLSTDGDLWQRHADPEGDGPRWAFFGSLARVEPGDVAERLRPNLARLRAAWLPSAIAAHDAMGSD